MPPIFQTRSLTTPSSLTSLRIQAVGDRFGIVGVRHVGVELLDFGLRHTLVIVVRRSGDQVLAGGLVQARLVERSVENGFADLAAQRVQLAELLFGNGLDHVEQVTFGEFGARTCRSNSGDGCRWRTRPFSGISPTPSTRPSCGRPRNSHTPFRACGARRGCTCSSGRTGCRGRIWSLRPDNRSAPSPPAEAARSRGLRNG